MRPRWRPAGSPRAHTAWQTFLYAAYTYEHDAAHAHGAACPTACTLATSFFHALTTDTAADQTRRGAAPARWPHRFGCSSPTGTPESGNCRAIDQGFGWEAAGADGVTGWEQEPHGGAAEAAAHASACLALHTAPDDGSGERDQLLPSNARSWSERLSGRKRGLAVDVLGLIIGVVVLAASAHDKAAGTALLDQAAECPTIERSRTEEKTGLNTLSDHPIPLNAQGE